MVFSLFLVCTAAVSAASVEDLKYKQNIAKQIIITGCNVDAEGTLNIPKSINGEMVVEIEEGAFAYCRQLTSIIVPDSVTWIGGFAFQNCTALKSVVLPRGLIEICNYTFMGCTGLQRISIPFGVVSVGSGAFYNCDSLNLVSIPPTVASVGENLFGDCDGLSGVEAPVKLKDLNVDWLGDRRDKVKYYCKVAITRTDGYFIVDGEEVQGWTGYPWYGTTVLELIEAPEGFRCRFEVDGEEWDSSQPITKDVTINVSLVRVCTVTYTGDYEGAVTIDQGMSAQLPQAPEGYVYYFYDSNGNPWHGQNVKTDIEITVRVQKKTYAVSFEPEGGTSFAFSVEHGETFDNMHLVAAKLGEPPEGYHYTYTANGEVWNPDDKISGPVTVAVKTEINTYTVTYIGDYRGEDKVIHGADVLLPNAEEGYHYLFMINGNSWDGTNVTENLTVTVSKSVNVYSVRFVGDYIGVITVTHGQDAVLPQAPDGSRYSFKRDNQEWTGKNITENVTVTVTKIVNRYTVTFIGDYSGETIVKHGEDVVLPKAETGYYYTFTVDGIVWDGTHVTKDITVTVTERIKVYTVTFVGDYSGECLVEHGASVSLPAAPAEQVYRFFVSGNTWDGRDVISNTTVMVTALWDGCSLVSAETFHDLTFEGTTIAARSYAAKVSLEDIKGSKGATVKLYRDAACSAELEYISIPRTSMPTLCYLDITAQSGRRVVYTLQITREVVENLGEMEFVSSVSGNITLRMKNTIPGIPEVKVLCSLNGITWQEYETTYSFVNRSAYAKGLKEDTDYWVKVAANYGDLPWAESDTIKIHTNLSDDCDILEVETPMQAVLDSAKRAIYAKVANSFSNQPVKVKVSPFATWELYATLDAKEPIPDKTLILEEGKETVAYIKVVAQNGYSTKTYKITIYRQRKAERPEISVNHGWVTIYAPEGSTVVYTTAQGYDVIPTPGIIGKTYIRPFAVPRGSVVQAIVQKEGIEEDSDPAICEVFDGYLYGIEIDKAQHTETGVDWNLRLLTYEGSGILGELYVAVYDESGVLLEVFHESVDSTQTELTFSGTMEIAGSPAYCQAFFWNEQGNPLSGQAFEPIK